MKFPFKKFCFITEVKFRGRSADNPSVLAKTMLGAMIFCLNVGPKVIFKLVPVSRFQKDLYKQINLTSQCFEPDGATVRAIVCDWNVLSKHFKMSLFLESHGYAL